MPPSNIQAHHVFPQSSQFQGRWEGLNIYDPRFLQWWESPAHQRNASAYNAMWTQFFNTNRNPTQAEILRKDKEIMSSFGFTVNY